MTTIQERLRAAAVSPDAFELPDLLLEAASALEEREAALVDALRSWSFGNGQQHTHSWHDRADWIERHKVVGNLWAKAILSSRDGAK